MAGNTPRLKLVSKYDGKLDLGLNIRYYVPFVALDAHVTNSTRVEGIQIYWRTGHNILVVGGQVKSNCDKIVNERKTLEVMNAGSSVHMRHSDMRL